MYLSKLKIEKKNCFCACIGACNNCIKNNFFNEIMNNFCIINRAFFSLMLEWIFKYNNQTIKNNL